MAKKAAPALSKALKPKDEAGEGKLRLRLLNAGYHSPASPQLFLAIKAAVALAGVAAGVVYGGVNYGMTLNFAFAVVICGGVGFYLPEGRAVPDW